MSTDTVVRRLREVGIVRRKALQKPYLSAAHKAKRLAFCLKYKEWGVEEWNKVLFTDEAKIEIPKPRSVWRKKGEELLPQHVVGTRRWGVNVMIWGSISAKGPGPFTFIRRDGKALNAAGYKTILEENIRPLFQTDFLSSYPVFQHDNAPCHTARTVSFPMRCNSTTDIMKKPLWEPIIASGEGMVRC